jgi:hypothetical protein
MSTVRYTSEERAAAIELLREHGLAETWRMTGISKPTLSLWGKDAGLTFDTTKTAAATAQHEARQAELRSVLRVGLLEKAVDLLERMDSPHVEFKGKDADMVEYPIAPAGAVQNYATSVGILIDKYRLEMGEVTGRTESQTVTGGMNDDERTRLRDAIDRFYGRGSAGSGDDGRTADSGSDGARTEVRE